jgi:hypothetical protein
MTNTTENSSNNPSDETYLVARGGGAKAKPYGTGTQIFVFGIHGTENGPGNVYPVTKAIAEALDKTTSGKVLYNSNFKWTGTLVNEEYVFRQGASWSLASHVLSGIDKAIQDGTFDRNKPIVINLVGHSHGGNVAIQAIDDIAKGLKERGLNNNTAIHLTTLATPVYELSLMENPVNAAKKAAQYGVSVQHTNFHIQGDPVIRIAKGHNEYHNNFTRNIELKWDSSNNMPVHSQPAQNPATVNIVAANMASRFRGFAPTQGRAAAGSEGLDTAIAVHPSDISAQPKRQNETIRHASSAFGPYQEHHANLVSKVDDLKIASKSNSSDIAATLLQAAVNNKQFDIEKPMSLMASTKNDGTLILAQNTGSSNVREIVDTKLVQPGSSEKLAEAFANKQTETAQASTEHTHVNKPRIA